MNDLTSSQQPSANRNGSVVGGIILIGIGLIFLLQNFGFFYFGNWWALFILLGTAAAWGSAWNHYQNNGHRITPAVMGAFVGGIFPLAVALIFLFNLDWGTMWPVFLIIAGVSVLSRSLVSSN
jgi:hypothetical protein